MKRILTLALIGIIPVFLFGQAPQAFNYQAVVRTSDGVVISNTPLNFTIELLLNGETKYTEDHLGKYTGDYGIVNFQVGTGTNATPDFSEIDWTLGQYQIRIKVNGAPIGEADIVSVPYALYAERSGSGGSEWVNVGDTILYRKDVKFGLGVDNPTHKVHVLGDIFLQAKSSPYKAIWFADENGAERAYMNVNYTLAPANITSFDFNLFAPEEEGTLAYRFFRGTNSNSAKYVGFYKGDGTPEQSARIAVDGTSTYFNLPTGSSDGGDFGIGKVPSEGRLDIQGPTGGSKIIALRASAPNQDAWISSYDEEGDGMWILNMGDRSHNNRFALFSQQAQVYQFWVDTSGMTHVKTLQIHGGGDITEPFEMSAKESYPEGSLVVIDSENTGKLTISTQAYDKRVAGVISGAGGIKPGLSLQQDGVLDNGQPVALAGRVYVQASAINGAIHPGDLLTSSDIPGYAMKATNKKKRQGAVIGKAMSELNEEEGLVLLLVQPQ